MPEVQWRLIIIRRTIFLFTVYRHYKRILSGFAGIFFISKDLSAPNGYQYHLKTISYPLSVSAWHGFAILFHLQYVFHITIRHASPNAMALAAINAPTGHLVYQGIQPYPAMRHHPDLAFWCFYPQGFSKSLPR